MPAFQFSGHTGLIGGKLGRVFARAGDDVVFSYSRSRQKLKDLAEDGGANARAGTPADAAQNADAVLLAVHWTRVEMYSPKLANYQVRLS